MICHKCGAETADNSLRCSHCGIKVNMYCPECGSLNPFGSGFCGQCGAHLIISCKSCGALNMYFYDNCRKCGAVLKESSHDAPAETRSYAASSLPGIELNTELPVLEGFDKLERGVSGSLEQTSNEHKEEEFVSAEQDEESKFPAAKNNAAEDLTETVPRENTEEENTAGEKASEETAEFSETQEAPLKRLNAYQGLKAEDYSGVKIHSDAVIKIADSILNPESCIHITGVSGKEGSGKTAVLNQVSEIASDKGCMVLKGSCTPLVQISSFGFFQDAFLKLMDFPLYTKSTESFIRDFTKSRFAGVFSFLKSSELTALLNVFYPSQKDSFENVLKNKTVMFSIFEKIIRHFTKNNKLLIAVDNFELLDGASYDFILYMIRKGMFNENLKMTASYSCDKDIKTYFELSEEQEAMFNTVKLQGFDREGLLDAAERACGIRIEKFLDEEFLNTLIENAEGSAVIMEQETAYLFDTGYIRISETGVLTVPENRPRINFASFDELISARVQTLPPSIKNVLYTAAIMGCRFASGILSIAVPMPVEKVQEILNFLIKNLFLQSSGTYTCEFKSLSMWKLVYQEAKEDLQYKENAQRLYMTMRPLILSNSLQKLICCTASMNENEEFLIWQTAAGITAKLGDTNLYVIALKQCLKLIDNHNELMDAEAEKIRMHEEIGKLLCEKSPQEAVTYLSNVLDYYIKAQDTRKIIDISSYFAKSCYLSGSSFGAVEAADAVIQAVKSPELGVSELETALIKTRKLKALLSLGNSGQVINLAAEEILPVIEKNLNAQEQEADKGVLQDVWFNVKTALARAYIMQGSINSAVVIKELYSAIDKHNYRKNYYKLKTDLLAAYAKTVSGAVIESNKMLDEISKAYKASETDADLEAWMHLLDIINRVLLRNYENIKTDLFELAAYANNINEHFIKNIAKLILGYITKTEGNSAKAEEIYSEQIMYFSKEKSAAGALFAWSLIVQKYIEEGQTDKALETASKALEIAQDAKINSFIFSVYFQKHLAEIYTDKADFVSAKMYLEKAAEIAQQCDLKYQLIELHIEYARYILEISRSQNTLTKGIAARAADMYKKAAAIAERLQLVNILEEIKKEFINFQNYCRMNSAEL